MVTTRFLLAGLAACWIAVATSAWRGRRRDVSRWGPVRCHRAVATLRHWSPDADGPPVAATWCRPLVGPTAVSPRNLPQQRRAEEPEPALMVSSTRPR